MSTSADLLRTTDNRALLADYQRIRQFSDQIAAPLSPEDCMVQSMADVSPTRWHLAHTTWFFETFVLAKLEHFSGFDPQFNYLFNSYYNRVGKQFPRPQRGLISRPGLERIREYRRFVDSQMIDLLQSADLHGNLVQTIRTGLNHEQQHQELMLTDIKHVLSCNPTYPVYGGDEFYDSPGVATPEWMSVPEGLYEVGHGGEGFAFDNEAPRHRVFLPEFALATEAVTCGQYIEFIEDGGYQRPDHWLSLGWATVCEQGWDAPLYWFKQDDRWMQFTLAGLHEVDLRWPACHLSYFEADAFARWAGMRLPTEQEWEVALENLEPNAAGVELQFADTLLAQHSVIHPTGAVSPAETTARMLGCVWEWTSSSYAAYPGYRPPAGAIGEYNGKFMCNQYVLRGGSCASSSDHIRPTYRNFFPPAARWQFSGLRLAK
jgi:ergothioneine biosynthesis protein EgtB